MSEILYSYDSRHYIESLIRPSDRRGIELARYRNMRSKRRCSLCLQFALLLGAGPVLHRPTSLVIHRLEWNLSTILLFVVYCTLRTKMLYVILVFSRYLYFVISGGHPGRVRRQG